MTCCERLGASMHPGRHDRVQAVAWRGSWAVAWGLGALCHLVLVGSAHAQTPPHRNFPAAALRGELWLVTPPEASLNGAPARLAPGARIRGEDNLLRLPAALSGQRLLVHYTLEPTTGLVLDVWILNPTERAREPWPASPEQARAWRFDPSAQTWTRP